MESDVKARKQVLLLEGLLTAPTANQLSTMMLSTFASTLLCLASSMVKLLGDEMMMRMNCDSGKQDNDKIGPVATGTGTYGSKECMSKKGNDMNGSKGFHRRRRLRLLLFC